MSLQFLLLKYIHTERLIHSFKTMVACLIGYFLSKFTGLPADQWVVITIIVVMCAQIYVGSVLQKSYSRFLGTFLGCLFAMITILFYRNTPFAIAIMIGLSSFIFSYLATSRESLSMAGTLGAATTAIILLSTPFPTFLLAIERFLEISLGILIATIVSQFFLPIHAYTHLRRTQMNTLEQLCDFYRTIMSTKPNDFNAHELEESIVNTLLKQRQLAKESAREKNKYALDSQHFIQSLYYERELLRSINSMHHALNQLNHTTETLLNSPILQAFSKALLTSLEAIIKTIEKNKPIADEIQLPSIETLKIGFAAFKTAPTQEELIYIDGFLFSAETLAHSVESLARLYSVPVYKT